MTTESAASMTIVVAPLILDEGAVSSCMYWIIRLLELGLVFTVCVVDVTILTAKTVGKYSMSDADNYLVLFQIHYWRRLEFLEFGLRGRIL
jgi:hypothetical protein